MTVSLSFLGCISAIAVQYLNVGFEDPCLHTPGITVNNGIVYDRFIEDDERYYGVLMEDGTNRMWISASDAYNGGRCLGTQAYAVSTGTKDRAEFRSVSWKDSYGLTFGQTRYYGYAMKIDDNSVNPTGGMHVMQVWQPNCDSNIPLTLSYRSNNGSSWVFAVEARTLTAETTLKTFSIPLGEWVKIVWELTPSYPGFGGGGVKLWVNDVQELDWSGNWGIEPGTVMPDDSVTYTNMSIRCGIYRGDTTSQQVIRYDDFKYADSCHEADPDVDIEWNFKSSADGWTVREDIEHWMPLGSCMNGDLTGDDSGLLSPDNLNLSCDDISVIRVKMRNATAGTQAAFYFTTTDADSFSGDKRVNATLTANDFGYTEYVFEMDGNSLWDGTLKQLRFDPVNHAGVTSGWFSIDYIDLEDTAVCCAADDFSGAASSYSTDASLIGRDWENSNSSNPWKVNGSNLCLNTVSAPGVLYNTSLSTVCGSGNSFLLSADVSADINNGWSGIVFNYQNPSNYYVLRLKAGSTSYQLLGVEDNANTTVFGWSDASSTFIAGTLYTLTVASDSEYEFGFTISDGASTLAAQSVVDSNTLFRDGYAGLYSVINNAIDPDARFDDFNLNVFPASNLDMDLDWDFEEDAGGWTVRTDVQNWGQDDGRVSGDLTDDDPGLMSPDNLDISCDDIFALIVRMRNQTAGTQASCYFTTTEDSVFNADKRVIATLVANDAGYTTYKFDMNGNAYWTGALKQLRLDPVDSVSSGSFSIEFIDLYGSVVSCAKDSFDRADTAYSSGSSSIGADWINGDSSDAWKICDEKLYLDTVSSPGILYNSGQETTNGNGVVFTLQADVSANVSNGWAGIVFNLQDASNYYVLRIKGGNSAYQLIKVVNGANSLVMVNESNANGTFETGVFYTLLVTSEEAGEFDFFITETGKSMLLNPVSSASDTGTPFEGGCGGFYSPTANVSANPDAMFDNYNLEVVPCSL